MRASPWREPAVRSGLLLRGGGNGEVACKRDSVSDPVARSPGDHPSVRPTRGCPWRLSTSRTNGPFAPLLGLAPGGVYRADDVTVAAGALLPHRFTLTCDLPAETGRSIGGLSLLHCSVRSPRPGSRQHPALRSPDFPRRCSTHRRGHPATSPLRGGVYDARTQRVPVSRSVRARCRCTSSPPASAG